MYVQVHARGSQQMTERRYTYVNGSSSSPRARIAENKRAYSYPESGCDALGLFLYDQQIPRKTSFPAARTSI